MTRPRPSSDDDPGPLRIPNAHRDLVTDDDMHLDFVTPKRAAEIRRDIELDRPNRPPSLRAGRRERCTRPGCEKDRATITSCYTPPWKCPLKQQKEAA